MALLVVWKSSDMRLRKKEASTGSVRLPSLAQGLSSAFSLRMIVSCTSWMVVLNRMACSRKKASTNCCASGGTITSTNTPTSVGDFQKSS